MVNQGRFACQNRDRKKETTKLQTPLQRLRIANRLSFFFFANSCQNKPGIQGSEEGEGYNTKTSLPIETEIAVAILFFFSLCLLQAFSIVLV